MSSVVLRLLCLLGLALAAGARAEDGTIIALRAGADLPGLRYTLGDIAEVESSDPALRKRLTEIAIGAVPRPHFTDTVTRQQIESLVRQEVSLAGIEWRGADTVRIGGQGQRVAAETLSDAAVRALYTTLSGQFETIELRPVSGFAGISVPAGTVRVAARVPAPQQVARRMSALVDVSVDGQVVTTVPVWFAVRATRPALLARFPLKPGADLHIEDFQLQSVDVAARAGLALPADAELDGIRLRRPLLPGMALGAAQVEARPPVVRDAKVAVRVVRGAVTIETTGQALADARLGELTKVRNPGTNESYSARVVGDGVVLVSAR